MASPVFHPTGERQGFEKAILYKAFLSKYSGNLPIKVLGADCIFILDWRRSKSIFVRFHDNRKTSDQVGAHFVTRRKTSVQNLLQSNVSETGELVHRPPRAASAFAEEIDQ